jgi:MFS transporter, BCD family, chlorophyll transporter
MKPVRTLVRINAALAGNWARVGTRFLPFADAATRELPMGRLLRLSLFQVTVGMALALLNGTLNRVMIVELDVPAWLVSLMVALPLLFAPFRALVGFRSDTHRSALGWRRVPYIWMGSLLQFGGLAIMPFALLVLSGDTHGPVLFGQLGAGLAFLLVGAGLHTTQTAGLALATDLAPPDARPRVVALLYVMLLLGMVGSALVFGILLADFKQVKLIQVIQGAALLTMLLNMTALWKQEARDPSRTRAVAGQVRPRFRDSWNRFIGGGRASRLLVAVGLGSAAFSMQDILLEPYGGQIMGLAVGDTSALTALLAGGALAAFALASRWLFHGGDACRLAAFGALAGVVAFAAVVFADPMRSALLFRVGAILIGFGGGLFSVGTLTAAMGLESGEHNGLALGAWGAVQASASGLAIAMGGALRDVVSTLAQHGALGPVLTGPAIGYSVVYHLEILLLFATLVAIGPLVGAASAARGQETTRFGLAELPG